MNNRSSKSQNPKKMQKTDTKHVQNKQHGVLNQRIDLDPSRAWIRNSGVGTTRELLKRKSKHDKTMVRSTTTPSPTIESDSSENDKFNDVEKRMDNTMVSVKQINAAQSADSVLEKTNGMHNSDSIAFHTCLDMTPIDANESKSIDTTLINTKTTHSKPAHSFKTNNISTHFPFKLTTSSDEISLYEPKGIMDFMNGRIGNEQKLSDDELLAMKRELNEGYDGAFICVTSPHDFTLVNREFDDIKPSRVHELSIDLGAFDSPSIWSDSGLKNMPLSPSFNSTALLSTNTIAQINEVAHDLRHIGSIECKLMKVLVVVFVFLDF